MVQKASESSESSESTAMVVGGAVTIPELPACSSCFMGSVISFRTCRFLFKKSMAPSISGELRLAWRRAVKIPAVENSCSASADDAGTHKERFARWATSGKISL